MTSKTVRLLCFVLGIVLLLVGVASAEPVPPQAGPVISGIDIGSVLTGVAIALGGAGVLLGGLAAILHAIAPRTKTTLDDRAAALLDAMHGRIDGLHESLEEILGHVHKSDGGTHTVIAPPLPPRDPQAGKSTPLAMVGLAVAALFAVLLTCALTGCTHAQRVEAKHAAIACAKADALPIAVLFATWALDSLAAHKVNWQAIEVDAVKHGSLIGGCAADKFVAATTAHASASVLPMAPSEGERMLERLRAQWGGVEWVQ